MQIVKDQKKKEISMDAFLDYWITIESKLKRWACVRMNTIQRRKRANQLVLDAETREGLHNPEEQKRLITKFNMIQDGKGGIFGRKHKRIIENKISYMIRNGIIQVKT